MIHTDPHRLLLDLGFSGAERMHATFGDVWVAVWNGRAFLIAVEKVGVGGRENLESRFARGCLRLDEVRSASSAIDRRRFCVVIRAPALSRATERSLAEFARRCHPATGWVVTNGLRRLGGTLGSDTPQASATRGSAHPPRRGTLRGGFSDRFLACAKVLLLTGRAGTGSPEFTAMRVEGESDVQWLARAAGVSVPHVHRFLRTYERLGFIARDASGIRVIRRRELLEGWALRMVDQFDSPTIGSVSEATLRDWIRRGPGLGSSAGRSTAVAFGVHAAAEMHRVHEVENAPLSLFVDGDPFELADRLGVEFEGRAPRLVELHRPRFPHALWRGVVDVGVAWPVTDVVQTYVDLARHPRRGAEAANALRRRFPEILGEDL